MAISREERIINLKHHFAKAGKILPYADLGKEGRLNEATVNASERLLTIQASLIERLTLLGKTSLDQISVSYETMRHLEFFGREVFRDDNRFQAEQRRTGKVMETYMAASTRELFGARTLHDAHCNYILTTSGLQINLPLIGEAERLHNNIVAQGGRYDDAKDDLAFLYQRYHLRFPLFDEDQEPSLRGKTPQIALRELYQKTVGHTEQSIELNIDYATSLLSRMQLIKNRLMPVMPALHKEWEQEHFDNYLKAEEVIDHIDALSGIHQERTDFMNAQPF